MRETLIRDLTMDIADEVRRRFAEYAEVPASGSSSWRPPSEDVMGFGKGAFLWILGIPLPIILLLALFWR